MKILSVVSNKRLLETTRHTLEYAKWVKIITDGNPLTDN